jgi:hypothetical protein
VLLVIDDFATVEFNVPKTARRDGWVVVLTHALLTSLTLALLCLLYPKFEAIFADFGVPMPLLTRSFVVFEHFLTKYFAIVAPLVAALLLVELSVLQQTGADPRYSARSGAWGFGITLVLVATMVGATIGAFLPLITLISKLSG